jgi:hypothetical protein
MALFATSHKVTAPTGRIQTISYSGLTTTSIDDGKTTTATLDAFRHKIETTDPEVSLHLSTMLTDN